MRQTLLRFIEIEETVAGIYRHLAGGAEIDEELRDLLADLANEEDDHANQLRLALRLLREDIFATATIPRERIAQGLQKARDIYRQVQAAALGPEATMALGIRLEEEFSDVHAHCAADFADTKMAELFRSLAADDRRHAEAMSRHVVSQGKMLPVLRAKQTIGQLPADPSQLRRLTVDALSGAP